MWFISKKKKKKDETPVEETTDPKKRWSTDTQDTERTRKFSVDSIFSTDSQKNIPERNKEKDGSAAYRQ